MNVINGNYVFAIIKHANFVHFLLYRQMEEVYLLIVLLKIQKIKIKVNLSYDEKLKEKLGFMNLRIVLKLNTNT